jgi:hypothetical protein
VSLLEDLQIERVAQGPSVTLYVRGKCMAAVGETQGSTGFLTERGIAYLVWREDRAYLAGKSGETEATAEQLEEIQRFSRDLAAALGTASGT